MMALCTPFLLRCLSMLACLGEGSSDNVLEAAHLVSSLAVPISSGLRSSWQDILACCAG